MRDICLASEMFFFHVIELYEKGQTFEPPSCQEQTSVLLKIFRNNSWKMVWRWNVSYEPDTASISPPSTTTPLVVFLEKLIEVLSTDFFVFCSVLINCLSTG